MNRNNALQTADFAAKTIDELPLDGVFVNPIDEGRYSRNKHMIFSNIYLKNGHGNLKVNDNPYGENDEIVINLQLIARNEEDLRNIILKLIEL